MSFGRFARLRPFAIERFLMLRGFILGVHVLLALMIIGLVLLQRGKGAEAGAGFGSGASGTVFGARGTSDVVFEIDGGVCGAVLCDEPDARLSRDARPTAEPTSVLERAAQAATRRRRRAAPRSRHRRQRR